MMDHDEKTDPIDRFLQAEADTVPPPGLRARVMAELRRQARRPPPLPFPWARFAVGVAAGIALCALCIIHAPALGVLRWR
jgi:hypothetical protein